MKRPDLIYHKFLEKGGFEDLYHNLFRLIKSKNMSIVSTSLQEPVSISTMHLEADMDLKPKEVRNSPESISTEISESVQLKKPMEEEIVEQEIIDSRTRDMLNMYRSIVQAPKRSDFKQYLLAKISQLGKLAESFDKIINDKPKSKKKGGSELKNMEKTVKKIDDKIEEKKRVADLFSEQINAIRTKFTEEPEFAKLIDDFENDFNITKESLFVEDFTIENIVKEGASRSKSVDVDCARESRRAKKADLTDAGEDNAKNKDFLDEEDFEIEQPLPKIRPKREIKKKVIYTEEEPPKKKRATSENKVDDEDDVDSKKKKSKPKKKVTKNLLYVSGTSHHNPNMVLMNSIVGFTWRESEIAFNTLLKSLSPEKFIEFIRKVAVEYPQCVGFNQEGYLALRIGAVERVRPNSLGEPKSKESRLQRMKRELKWIQIFCGYINDILDSDPINEEIITKLEK